MDTFAIQIEAPTGERTPVIRENNRESNRLNNGISDETSNEIGRSISDNVENRMGNSISSYTLGNTMFSYCTAHRNHILGIRKFIWI